MSVIDFLLDLFSSEEQQDEFAQDPTSFLAENAPEGLTAEAILAAMPGVCAVLPEEQAQALRTAYGLDGGPDGGGPGGPGSGGSGSGPGSSGPGDGFPPPPTPDPGADPIEQLVQQINYYTNIVNTTTQNIDDRDTTVDASVNQNVTAFGDVNQDFDTDIVSGDGAVNNEGNNAQINTGDEAIQVGDDVNDSTLNTGNVGGSVTGDNQDSIVGNNNQAIIDSEVGAAAFGGGDATNVEARNANLGDGVQVNDSEDVNVNDGGGDLFDIEGSNIEESQIGGSGNTLQSNDTDIDIDADDGSAVAFGAGSEADAQQQNVDIDDVDGNVQVTGEDGTQLVDQSTNVDIDDSFNQVDQSVNDSYNIDDSLNTDISDDDLVDIDNSANQNDLSDDDAIDIA
jgi:hypothetical protein